MRVPTALRAAFSHIFWLSFRGAVHDITAISEYLSLSEHNFIQNFTRLRPHRDGPALIDQPDGACIFLEGHDCRIQPVKPIQCRGFPNTWNFSGWREVCKAIEITEP